MTDEEIHSIQLVNAIQGKTFFSSMDDKATFAVKGSFVELRHPRTRFVERIPLTNVKTITYLPQEANTSSDGRAEESPKTSRGGRSKG